MTDASTRVLCPVRPEEHEPEPGGATTEGRNGAQEESEEELRSADDQRRATGGGGDATHDETEDNEEARVAKPLRDPREPTAAERAAHEATHLPFRSWCAKHIAGRRDNPPHRHVPQDENAMPEVTMDYCFV